MLIDRDNWPMHRRWVVTVLLAPVGATGWYVAEAFTAETETLPGGSSLPGFVFGVVGGLIILFEMALWFRKKVRVWRIGRAQAWMVAHIWLGLLCLPVLIYHSGFRWGGTLSTVLMVLLVIVIVSGVWGLVMQQLLPRRMLDDLPSETIYSQIDFLSAQLISEGEQLVRATCGPEPGEEATAVDRAEPSGPAFIVVGAVRTVGPVQGKVLETRLPPAPVPDAESLRTFYRGIVVPFLRDGRGGHSPLSRPSPSAVAFQDIKTKVPKAAHGSVEAIERLCEQRRQWALQARLHFWLHNWLWVHLPLSVALVVLMLVHAYVAIMYS